MYGFQIRLDPSWFIIAVLITWTLAVGVFPNTHAGLSASTYWAMGVAGAIGLFISIVLHEFSHSIVARRYGIPMKGITLFVFGGVAEMGDEPPNPKSEFMMAIAGPIASCIIGGVFLLLGFLAGNILRGSVEGVLMYLGTINLILAAFNMVPAFPLDGGRVLRSALWHFKGNLRKATRIAANFGSAFGILLFVLGTFAIITGNFISGFWWFLLGMFVRQAAAGAYQSVIVREQLKGEPVSKFMRTDVISVPGEITVRDLVEDYVYRHHYSMFPVVAGEELAGCVTTSEIRNVPKEAWERTPVSDIATKCDPSSTVAPNEDMMKAFTKMAQTGASQLMVVDAGKVVGIVSARDIMNMLAVRVELEDDKPAEKSEEKRAAERLYERKV